MMKSTPWRGSSGMVGSGRSGPSIPGLAVHIFGRDQLTNQWPIGAGADGDVAPARQLADHARVAAGQLQRNIAGDGRDAEHLDLGACEGQQDGDGVVLAGIGVDDDGKGH